MIEIRREAYRHHAILTIGQIMQMNIRTELIGHAVARKRRTAYLEMFVPGVLTQTASVAIHRPQIRHAITVGQKHNAPFPVHRAGVVRGHRCQRHGFGAALRIEAPQRTCRASTVCAHVVDITIAARKDHGFCIEKRGGFRAFQRQQTLRATGARHGHQLRALQRMKVARRRQHLALRRPAGHVDASAEPGEPLRHATGKRHHIGFGWAFITGGKRDPLPVGRNRRVRLDALMRGQSQRVTARNVDLPQITLGGEHQRVAMQRRVTKIAARRPRCRRQ